MDIEEYFWKLANTDSASEVGALRDRMCADPDRSCDDDVFDLWLCASSLRAVTLGHKDFSGTVATRISELMEYLKEIK